MSCKRRINEGEKRKKKAHYSSGSSSLVLISGYKGSIELLELVLV